jgi:hypothetical protein
MRTFDWKQSLIAGEAGELRFVHLMRSRGHQVEDVRDITAWQKRDVDYIVGSKFVEVKTDFHDTGNIFIELVGSNNRPGCIFKSRADLWAYLFPDRDEGYLINIPELLLWLVDFAGEYERHAITTVDGYDRWTVLGIAVPIVQLTEAGIARRFRLPKVQTDARSEASVQTA